MSPSMLAVLLFALLVCTPVANAIQCWAIGNSKQNCPDKCALMANAPMCASSSQCDTPGTAFDCCHGKLCNKPKKKEEKAPEPEKKEDDKKTDSGSEKKDEKKTDGKKPNASISHSLFLALAVTFTNRFI